MFQMTTDVVSALKITLADFSQCKLSKILWESVWIIAKQLHAMAVSLYMVLSLPDWTPLDILKSFSIDFCDAIKRAFKIPRARGAD